MDRHSLPLDRLINSTSTTTPAATGSAGNGYAVNYGVGALLCLVRNTLPTEDVPIPPTECTADAAEASNMKIITLVATATIPGEGARTTLSTMIGTATATNALAQVPAVTASGTIAVNANLQIVANRNSAGPDKPVAQCAGDTEASCRAHDNIQKQEFPCDLFNFVFPRMAWKDTNADGFCETRRMVTYRGADGIANVMGADEAYLYAHATFIIPNRNITYANGSTPATIASTPQLATCAKLLNDSASLDALKGSAYGLVWDQQGCGIAADRQVGTAENPVLLVEDGSATVQGRLFGLLYVRPDLYGSAAGPLAATTEAAADETGVLNIEAGAAIHGAVVVHGTIAGNGGSAVVVHSPRILDNLGNAPALNVFHRVPGAWTDRFAY
jgi:hypothetical protein